MRRVFFVIVVGFISFLFALTGNIKVKRVVDGDTFTFISKGGNRIYCRIYGIDAPEKKQAFGKVSTDFLKQLIEGKQVKMDLVDIDRYGRAIVKIYFDKKDVSLLMIKTGNAWHYKAFSEKETDYAGAQIFAQKKRVGLWKSKNPTAPWDYRNKNKTINK